MGREQLMKDCHRPAAGVGDPRRLALFVKPVGKRQIREGLFAAAGGKTERQRLPVWELHADLVQNTAAGPGAESKKVLEVVARVLKGVQGVEQGLDLRPVRYSTAAPSRAVQESRTRDASSARKPST